MSLHQESTARAALIVAGFVIVVVTLIVVEKCGPKPPPPPCRDTKLGTFTTGTCPHPDHVLEEHVLRPSICRCVRPSGSQSVGAPGGTDD